jgi:hypothetical protein
MYDNASFADCVETTVRNLCNIATYNGRSLGVAPKDIELSSSLAKFYQTGSASVPAEVGNQLVHQSWTNVIENIPGASYNRLKLHHLNNTSYLPSEYEGFMPVDDSLVSQAELTQLSIYNMSIGGQNIKLYEKSVGNSKYLLVPKNSGLLCYELLPTASNMVVCLNNLFNLKLYDSQAIFTQDFAQSNFKKICDKFGWNLQTPVTDNVKSINIKICKGSTCFAVDLFRKAHGAVTVLNLAKFNGINQNFITADLYQQYPEKISEIISLLDTVDIEKLFEKVDKNETYFLQLLRNISVINPDRRLDVIERLLFLQSKNKFLDNIEDLIMGLPLHDPLLQSKNKVIDNYIADLIMGLPLHDPHYILSILNRNIEFTDKIKNSLKSFGDLYLLKEGISVESIKIFCSLVKARILDSQQIVGLLEKGMATGNTDVQRQVIRGLSYLAHNKVLDSQQIVKLCKKIMGSSGQDVRTNLMYELDRLKFLRILTSDQFEEIKGKGSSGAGQGHLGGGFRRSGISSMRHDPYSSRFVDDFLSKQADFEQAEFEEKSKNLSEADDLSDSSNVIDDYIGKQHRKTVIRKISEEKPSVVASQTPQSSQVFGSPIDAESERQKALERRERIFNSSMSQSSQLSGVGIDVASERQRILEQGQRMEDIYKRWDELEYPSFGGNLLSIQNRMPLIGQWQQPGLIALPKSVNVWRVALPRR